MNLHERMEIFNRALNPEPIMSDETIKSIRDSVSDPTGLKPFMKKRIEQSDDLQEQVDQLQAALQEQVDFTHTLEANIEQAKVETELYKQQHRHDKLCNGLISLFSALAGAVVGTVCTIIATAHGLL